MFKTLLLCLLTALSFAAVAEDEAITPTRNETQVPVVLHQLDSANQVLQTCVSAGAWPGRTLREVRIAQGLSKPALGCNMYDPNTRVCDVYTLRPRFVGDTERMENLGHEVLHCFEGRYHPEN